MKTSLKCEFALFQTSSLIPFHSVCQMLANFSGLEYKRTVSKFKRTVSKFRKRKQNVHFAYVQRRLRNVKRKRDARVKLFC